MYKKAAEFTSVWQSLVKAQGPALIAPAFRRISHVRARLAADVATWRRIGGGTLAELADSEPRDRASFLFGIGRCTRSVQSLDLSLRIVTAPDEPLGKRANQFWIIVL